jgi:hypothetical protein
MVMIGSVLLMLRISRTASIPLGISTSQMTWSIARSAKRRSPCSPSPATTTSYPAS